MLNFSPRYFALCDNLWLLTSEIFYVTRRNYQACRQKVGIGAICVGYHTIHVMKSDFDPDGCNCPFHLMKLWRGASAEPKLTGQLQPPLRIGVKVSLRHKITKMTPLGLQSYSTVSIPTGEAAILRCGNFDEGRRP